jgi:hypothetical protein
MIFYFIFCSYFNLDYYLINFVFGFLFLFFIFKFLKELNNYIWSNKKAGAPRDMYNHALDGIRYYVSHRLKRSNITAEPITFNL